MKFIPVIDEIAKIPEPFRTDWAKALRSSKQHKGALINCKDLEAMCCLGVACSLVGVKPEKMLHRLFPSSEDIQRIGVELKSVKIARLGEEGLKQSFINLNDRFLTHPQIADLLDGKTVEI